MILEHVPEGRLEMAALAGGFGRGEGGVLRDSSGEVHAFNDYDLVLFTRDDPDTGPLLAAAPALAAELHVDFVDFGILDCSARDRVAPTIFWYEFLEGHRVLVGPEDFLAGVPRVTPGALPLLEATRLLINRGMGLLWAWLHLEDAARDRESFSDLRRRFAVNAIHKGVLALGESALIRAGRYHVSYRERAKRVTGGDLELPPALGSEFREAHAEATDFKLHPRIPTSSPEVLSAWWRQVRDWHEAGLRWIEETRLGRPFGPWKNYPGRAGAEAIARGVRHPRRFVRDRYGNSPLRGVSRFLLDTESSWRAQLPFLLYGIGPEGLDGALLRSGLRGFGGGPSQDARRWRSLAGSLIGQWHP